MPSGTHGQQHSHDQHAHGHDHLHGHDHAHDDHHDHAHDDHDHGALVPYDADPEAIVLRTVGVDIGSSTSHLTFSELTLRRDGRALSSSYVVTDRKTIYESPIRLTPYSSPAEIDQQALDQYLTQEYRAAGVTPAEVDSGAVVVTGEAAMKQNADKILALFADAAGKFVCAVAGPNLEGALAAHGSGAVALSRDRTVLNVDIGGGTTKFAILRSGAVLSTLAISVGARLVAWDGDGLVSRVERTLAAFGDRPPRIGEPVGEQARAAFADRMTERIFEYIDYLRGRAGLDEAARRLLITDLPEPVGDITAISVSGGVAEYVYQSGARPSGDLGPLLGERIRARLDDCGLQVLPVERGIRATVTGASQYTVQVSGNTISVPSDGTLPLRNVPVIEVDLSGELDPVRVAGAMRQGLAQLDWTPGSACVGFSLRWCEGVDYQSLSSTCTVLAGALREVGVLTGLPLVLVIDRDVATNVAGVLAEELHIGVPLVVIDQVNVGRWDYIDIGELDVARGVVPVVVKSLVFR
jgi:ethanolamine utilization protein EutA